MNSSQLLAWLSSHWTAVWPAVSAVLLMLLRSRTPEQWVALGETSPRLQGVVRLLRAVGLDPAKAVSALVQIVSGRAPSRASTPPASPSRTGQSGRATVGAVALLLAAGLCLVGLGAMLSGCREPSNCNRQTDAWRCSPAGRPERCAEGNVWRSYAYGPCSLTGEVCVSVPGAAFCRPPRDAGAALPSNPNADASAPQE